MNDERDDLELLRRARALDRSIEPGRDLWDGISAELSRSAPARPSRFVPLALAASLLVGVTAVAMLFSSGAPDGGAPPAVAQADLLTVGLDPELVATRDELVTSLDAELAEMSPESQAAVAAGLQDIEQALARIHAELEDDPNSELLLELLVKTYTDQVILLGEMDGMTRSIRKRTEL